MHETIIAGQLISDAEKHGKVKSIVVNVGELAGIHGDDLERALKGMTKWHITVTEGTARVKCKCGYVGRPNITERAHDFVLFDCPKCRKIPKVVSGDEVVLKEVTVE